MALLELVMIVKNSGDILRKCLKTNKKYIDYWTIVDTGSTDNTPDIIREELNDIPGQLHFSDFTDFAETRNKAFDLAKKHCKYMIVLDDSYELSKDIRPFLEKTNKDAIFLKIGYFKFFLSNSYYSNRIIKTSSNIRYKYRVHESLIIPKNKTSLLVDVNTCYIIDHSNEEHQDRTKTRFKKDIKFLLLDQQDYPKDPRVIYYLARTHFNLNENKDALKYCKTLLEMTNVKEYTYYAEFNLISYEYDEKRDLTKYQLKLMDFQKRHKDRAEPSYNLAITFYEEGKIDKIDSIMNNLIKFPIPELGMTMIDHEVYEYSIPYLYIEIKFKLGMFDEGINELKKLIEKYPNDQKLLNMKYSVCSNIDISSKKFEQKTLVIHTAVTPFLWNPILDKNDKISGSEYMAVYMAKELRDLGYRVFIFGSFLDIENKKDNQMMLEGIQYIDNSYFSDFCLEYIVDFLIISRQIANLIYYKNIKNVYLWVHDVLPYGDFRFIQIHKEKFKSVIALSEWQKEQLLKYTGIKSESIYVSRNAIHPKRFLKEIEKTPFRFIYTSDPNRGLNNFIEMIPWIKEKYPQSTFYIFGKKEQITDEILLFINENDYIYLSPRISQEKLTIELKKSDVWLYPTVFTETYCISAVEAMASGCLVVSKKKAALTEIIHDRGVLVEDGENSNRELFKELCIVLDDPKKKEEILDRSITWALKQDFYTLALEWKKHLFV